jgi:hypothetical protein
MLSSQNSRFFIICLDSVCSDGGITVENPPAEETPDFAYKPCKDLKEAVIGPESLRRRKRLVLYYVHFLLLAVVFVQEDRVLRF